MILNGEAIDKLGQAIRSLGDKIYAHNILKIHEINDLQTAICTFRYVKGVLPPLFSNFFTYNRNIHSYPTRTRNNINLNNPTTLIAHKSLRHHGPDIWNNLPNCIKQKTFLNPLKKKNLQTIFIEKYLNK